MPTSLRVLILEDRPADAELLLYELRRAGYAPDSRRVETEADYLAHLEPTLDIILADYTLPQFNALRALHRLQERELNIPFIVVTGTIGEEAAVECIKQGASDYLLKDRLARLGSAIAHALEQKRLRDAKRQAEEEIRQRNEELTTLNQIGQALGRLARPAEILELIVTMIGQVVDNRNLYIALYDKANQYISFPIYTMYGQRIAQAPGRRLSNGLTEYVILTRTPLLISDHVKETLDRLGVASIGTQAECLLAVPMLAAEEVIGVIALQDYQNVGVFDASHLRLLSTFAAQAAIALENARLLEETHRRARELAALNQAGQLMASTLDLSVLLNRLMEQVKGLLNAEGASVLLCVPAENGVGDELFFAAVTGPGAATLMNRRMPVTSGIAGWVVREGQSALVTDAQNDPRLERSIDANTGLTTHSLLVVPLTYKGAGVGVIEAMNKMPGGAPDAQNAFDEHDLRVLEALSNSASIAIQNARLFEAEQRRVALFKAVNENALHLSSQLDLRTLLQTIIEQAARLVDAPMGTLWLLQPDGQALEQAESFNLPPGDALRRLQVGEGLAGRVVQSGEPMVLADYSQWPGRDPSLQTLPYRAMLAVPIKWQGQVLGVIGAIDTRPSRFGTEQVETVSLLATQAAVAIQNARLFGAIRQRVQELQILHAVAVTATGVSDEDALIERVTHIIGESLLPDFYGVLLVDPDAGVLRVHPSYFGASDEFKRQPIPLGQGITGTVAQRGQAWRVEDVLQVTEYRATQSSTRSELAVPIKVADRVLGVVNVESASLNAFGEDDERLLTTLTGQLATAIERLRSNAEREKLITELEAKNAELERFTYTVSHDLKSPLITIRGFLGFVEKDAQAGNLERLRADIVRITEATDKMQRLLSELLELSRIGRMMNPPQAVPFETIVREALELVRGRMDAWASKGRSVRVEIAPGLPTVYGDHVRLVEVMQNLVDNACKFMGEQPNPLIEIGQRGAESDGKPILFVRDNGVGIELQYHDKVFGLFNKLDAQTEGTGVGLALVKRIVEVHGGKIWVESEGIGKGTTFYFTLPQHESAEISLRTTVRGA